MPQDPSPLAWRLRDPARRIVARFAGVVCPPQVRAPKLAEGLLGEFELLLGALPTGARRSVLIAFVVFDQGARVYPRAHGRRFVHLGDEDADAYFRAVLARRRSGLGTALQRIKGLVVMCYYELPEVKEQLAYRPDAYIAAVSRRRLASYAAQIRAPLTRRRSAQVRRRRWHPTQGRPHPNATPGPHPNATPGPRPNRRQTRARTHRRASARTRRQARARTRRRVGRRTDREHGCGHSRRADPAE